MIWKKITINTNVEAADIVASVLFDNGIVGAEIEDNQNLSEEDLKKMYVDIPKINFDDGKSKVSFYVSIGKKTENSFDNSDKNIVDNSYMKSNDNIFTEAEFKDILKNIHNGLEEYRQFMDMGSLEIEEQELNDEDFLNKWKENFKSLVIDDINILPNWEKSKDGKLNIFIEPGNAFGTGQHATTKLCVKAIEKLVNEKGNDLSFLDIGTGSGILSIIAYKLGVNRIIAIDIDENCELNLKENLKLNSIDSVDRIDDESYRINFDKYKFIYGFGNIICDSKLRKIVGSEKYDIIVANILAPVLISLIEQGNIGSFLANGGSLILSGIIKEKLNDVLASLNKSACFKDISYDFKDEWAVITCKKGVQYERESYIKQRQ